MSPKEWNGVKENKYDDPVFFAKYAQMDRSRLGLRGGSRGALGFGAEAEGLAGAFGQHVGAADLLVGVTAVNAHVEVTPVQFGQTVGNR